MAEDKIWVEFGQFKYNTVRTPFKVELFRGAARYMSKDKKQCYGVVRSKSFVKTCTGVCGVVLAPCCQKWKKNEKDKPRGEKMALCGVVDKEHNEV